jgi:YegS/Rv2252/BmrU family lipid kinase
MTISFIVKGSAKNKNLVDPIIGKVHALNKYRQVIVEYTEYAGHAIDIAKKHTEKEVNIIIAMGGDGTLNEVLNGIMSAVKNKPSLGHFPLGTANDFSKTLGLEKNLEQFLNLLNSNHTISIDVGKIICKNKQAVSERYFINIADAGLGGFVAHKLNNSKKMLGGKITYFKVILTGILSFKKPLVKINFNDSYYEGKLMSLAICNGKSFGNGLIISPDAKINDGVFNITLLGDVTVLDYFKNIRKLKKGIKLNHPNIHYYTSKKIHLTTKEVCEVEADGEYVGSGETSFEIIPKSLNFLSFQPN